MRLEPVTGTPFTAVCKGCGQRRVFGGSAPFAGASGFADLDGEPFKAYYCAECVARSAGAPLRKDRVCKCGHTFSEHDQRSVHHPCNHRELNSNCVCYAYNE